MKTVQGDGHQNTLAIKIINYGEGPPAVDLSELAFTSWSTNDKVTITGTKSKDSIAGSIRNDVIDGGLGNDDLQGNQGGDTFVFNLSARGVDHIADFLRKEGDKIGLLGASFPDLKAGKLIEIGLRRMATRRTTRRTASFTTRRTGRCATTTTAPASTRPISSAFSTMPGASRPATSL